MGNHSESLYSERDDGGNGSATDHPKGQTELAKVAGAFAQMINTNAANQAPNRQEDNPHANT